VNEEEKDDIATSTHIKKSRCTHLRRFTPIIE